MVLILHLSNEPSEVRLTVLFDMVTYNENDFLGVKGVRRSYRSSSLGVRRQ